MSLLRRIRQVFCGHHDTRSEHTLVDSVRDTWVLTYWHCYGCGKTIGHRS